jgi:hypothetical protein
MRGLESVCVEQHKKPDYLLKDTHGIVIVVVGAKVSVQATARVAWSLGIHGCRRGPMHSSSFCGVQLDDVRWMAAPFTMQRGTCDVRLQRCVAAFLGDYTRNPIR